MHATKNAGRTARAIGAAAIALGALFTGTPAAHAATLQQICQLDPSALDSEATRSVYRSDPSGAAMTGCTCASCTTQRPYISGPTPRSTTAGTAKPMWHRGRCPLLRSGSSRKLFAKKVWETWSATAPTQ